MVWFLLGIRKKKKEEHSLHPLIHNEGCSSLPPLAQLPIFSWQYQRKGWWWAQAVFSLRPAFLAWLRYGWTPLSSPEQHCTLGVPSHQGAQGLGAWTFPPHSVMCVLSHLVMSDSCNPMNYSPPNSSVRGIFQARILEWVAISYSTFSNSYC